MENERAHPKPPNSLDNTPGGSGVFAIAVAGGLLQFAAQPPLALGWLGWIAPVPWLLLVARAELNVRRPYWKIWAAGLFFWIPALHWLRLPHPAAALGWIALAAYMACYAPAFVWLSRRAVHGWRLPLVVAAPVVWTGLELARGHLLSGFLMASLAHTQFRYPIVTQIADLGGEYAVDFVMLCVASAITVLLLQRRASRDVIAQIAFACVVLGATLAYGAWRTSEFDSVRTPGPRLALIQGNSLADWKQDLEKRDRIMAEYSDLSLRAVAEASDEPVDLVIWPETMFRAPLIRFTDNYASSPLAERLPADVATLSKIGEQSIANLVRALRAPVLVGVDVVEHALDANGDDATEHFNAVVITDDAGDVLGEYAKVHRVMFGEYIPFADALPWLRNLSPVTMSVTAGAGPVALASGEWTFAPNICYESVLPHVIRRQVVTLAAAGERPDVLVNLTNDAWYWGSSELDMHFACGVFRAVEMRTPLVIAANGGLTAQIDSCGRVVQTLPRQTPDYILADVALDPRESLYARFGDIFAATCALVCVVLALTAALSKKPQPQNSPTPDP